MFVNGKLIKKKKTPTSEKLTWSDCETLTFELNCSNNGHQRQHSTTGSASAAALNSSSSASSTCSSSTADREKEKVAFMLVLSWSSDVSLATSSASSPSSPESPEKRADALNNGSRKDRHIGHFVLGEEGWREMTAEPRKQFSKWAKLM